MTRSEFRFSKISDNLFLMLSIKNDNYYKINKTAHIILTKLSEGMTVGDIQAYLVEEYGLTSGQATDYIRGVIEQLSDRENSSHPLEASALVYPFRIGWNITNKCNLTCKHCYTEANDKKFNELNTEECLKVVDILDHINCLDINLTGGEPMVRKDFGVILETIAERGFGFSVFTNATLVEKWRKSIEKYWGSYLVSIDGLEKEHNMLRGKGTFKKTVDGVRLLRNSGQRVTVNATLSSYNYKSFLKFVEFVVEELDVNLQVGMMLPIGRGANNAESLVTPSLYGEVVKQVMAYSAKRGEAIAAIDFSQSDSDSPKTTLTYMNKEGVVNISNDEWICNAGYAKVSIAPNGDVFPCAFIRGFKMGNLIKDDSEEVWNSENKIQFADYIKDSQSHICKPVEKKFIFRYDAYR